MKEIETVREIVCSVTGGKDLPVIELSKGRYRIINTTALKGTGLGVDICLDERTTFYNDTTCKTKLIETATRELVGIIKAAEKLDEYLEAKPCP